MMQNLISHKTLNVFLCGESLAAENGMRSLIYNELKEDSSINIIYPEWIFPDLYTKSDSFNILELEGDLAESVDLIIIPLISNATYSEAGLFSANEKLSSKIVLLNDLKHKKAKSFINLGPINLVKKGKGEIVWYNDFDDACDQVVQIVYKHSKYKRKKKSKKLNWFDYSDFLLSIICLSQEIEETEMLFEAEYLGLDVTDYWIKPSLAILRRKKLINERTVFFENKKIKKYTLSDIGYAHIFKNQVESAHKKISDLRLKKLYTKYGKDKFLGREDLEF